MALKDPAEAARAILAQRRQTALEQASARRAKAYAAIPELEAADRELNRLMMETASAAAGPNAAEELSAIRSRMEEVRKKKTFYLVHGGFSENDLEPHFTCPDCRDTGYVRGKRCRCYYELYNREMGQLLPSAVTEGKYSFDRFELRYYPDVTENGINPRALMARILERCKNYAASFDRGSESLLFVGGTGLGKTHLSLAIAAEGVKRGKLVLYSSAQGIIDRFERIRFSRSPSQDDFDWTRAAPTADLLVIDDLGSEFVNSFSQSVLYTILNDRMLAERPTIISTNLELPRLSAIYEQRIVSRILCGFVALTFNGRDIRFLQQSEKALANQLRKG